MDRRDLLVGAAYCAASAAGRCRVLANTMYRMLAFSITLYGCFVGYASAYSEAHVCDVMKQTSAMLSKPTWVDKVTRSDGMSFSCELKIAVFKKFVVNPLSQELIDWQQREWDDFYCKDPEFRDAILAGWSLINLYITADAQRSVIVSQCTR